jgi:hypothetical protein
MPSIIAMACGVESGEDTFFFGETREHWLRKYPALPNGIPSPCILFLNF